MIEPRSISLPDTTRRYYTEEKDGVRYSGSFVDLEFSVDSDRVKVRGLPVLRRWRKVTKLLALFSNEKEKWVCDWSISGPYFDRLNMIDVIGGSGFKNRPSFEKIVNGGLKHGLVITEEFIQEVMSSAVAEVTDYHRVYEPQILRPSAVRRIA